MTDHDRTDHGASAPQSPATLLPGQGAGAASVPRSTDRLVVDFKAEGAGVEELSWGQRDIWTTMVRQRTWMPIGGRTPIAAGRTLADVADELRYFMGRFQTMRTLLRVDGDRTYQHVFDSGEVELEIFDADAGGVEELADAVEAHYRHLPLDFTSQWPVRAAVVRGAGVPKYIVSLIGHIAMDSYGATVMMRDMAAWPGPPVVGMQPLEQARWQCSPAGQRVDERALRYWEQTLRAIPSRPYPVSAGCRPRFWSGEFRSAALHGAVQAIARRAAADTSSVLLALYAIAIAAMSGTHPVVVRPIVDNRFRPGLADVVCPATQGGICLLEIAGGTVDDAVEAARRGGLSAYKYAYFHPGRLTALIDRITGERGADFGLSCYFNDRRVENRGTPTGTLPTAAELRDARGASSFNWIRKRDNPIELLFLHVDDDPAGVLLTIETDTDCFSPEDVEGLVRNMEEVAVAAAFEPALPCPVA